MLTKKIFLASSSELEEDRREFEIFINRKNKEWVDKSVFLQLIVWEDFLDAVSKTRLQDEYNKEILKCDLFVMLFCTKVGQYTEEEFETAFGQFKSTNKPFIFTYFKDKEISSGSLNQTDLMSLWAFQEKLRKLGHFYTSYKNIDALKFHFNQQLDKLVTNGFIELNLDNDKPPVQGNTTYQAKLNGNGTIAQGTGAIAGGPGSVIVGGKNTGNINTGTQTNIETAGGAYVNGSVNTGGGDFVGRDKITHGLTPKELEPLFAPLLATITQTAPAGMQATAEQHVEDLKSEVANGQHADDGKIAKIIEGLVGKVPDAVSAVVSLFATPVLGGLVGPVTEYVLNKLKTS